MMKTFFGLACFVSFAFACGGAKPGGSCNTTGFVCQDEATSLECLDKKWVALPCGGSAGCEETTAANGDEIVKCDITGNQAGDACASSSDHKGICKPDGTAVLECRQDAGGTYSFAEVATCSSCSVQGDQVVCEPK